MIDGRRLRSNVAGRATSVDGIHHLDLVVSDLSHGYVTINAEYTT